MASACCVLHPQAAGGRVPLTDSSTTTVSRAIPVRFRIQVAITIAGDGAVVDFTGSSPQAAGSVNAITLSRYPQLRMFFAAAGG